MEAGETTQVDTAALLKAAAAMPAGAEMVDYNPLETIPTLAVGKEILPGQTITGYFVATERLASPKFKNSQEVDERGVPVQYRHVLRLLDGQKLAIWTTGELRNTFEKIQAGELISLTYRGKGSNANGQQQHFFDYKKLKAAAH